MIGLATAVITVAIVLFVLAGVAMFFDMAMGDGERLVLEREAETRRWSPPFISGQDLLDWARSRATGIVRDVVKHEASAETTAEITNRLNRGATDAMLPGARPREVSRSIPCPQAGQGVIGVSPPEAIQLATYLRQSLSSSQLKTLRDEAQRNAKLLAEGPGRSVTDAPCSLQGDDCVCLAYSDRPMECRPLHAAIMAEQLDLNPLTGASASSPPAAHIETISQGIREGLSRGLESAGLDGGTYELHSALVAALDDPEAAEHWAAAEDVFGACNVIGTKQGLGPHLHLEST